MRCTPEDAGPFRRKTLACSDLLVELAQLIGGDREVEIFLRDSDGIVGHEGEPDLVIADVDIRVVTCVFGNLADLVDECQRGSKVLEQECSNELARFNLPVWYGNEAGPDFVIGEGWHEFLLGKPEGRARYA